MRQMGLVVLTVVLLLGLMSPWAWAGVTERVSVSSDGVQGNGTTGHTENTFGYCAINADGRFVAFVSLASNLVAGDTNDCGDVFVHDREFLTTQRVSVSSSGEEGNSQSWMGSCAPSISADGRFVAFVSEANNLVADDTNDYWDIFVRDRMLNTTERVSVSSSGAQGNGYSCAPSISADGRFVAFFSDASNLAPGDTNNLRDVFVHDRVLGTTERISVSSSGAQGNGNSCHWWGPSINGDGRLVVFESDASNLVPEDTNRCMDIFVRDRVLGVTEIVSVSNSGAQGNSDSGSPSISAEGRFVAFGSGANNLIPGDTDEMGIFVRDRLTGVTDRVSIAGYWPSISSNGRLVAYMRNTDAYWSDVFVHDRQTGVTERVSIATGGTQGNDYSWEPSISADGRFVAFTSWANNLVLGDTNGCGDAFVRDRWATGSPPPPGSGPGAQPPGGTSVGLVNPYSGYGIAGRAKGQTHCHYYNDYPGPAQGIGSLWPGAMVGSYGSLGYDFICVTEHYHCTTPSTWPGAFFVSGCEEVTYDNRYDAKHFLGLGMNPPYGPANALESRYYPYDAGARGYGMKEVEEFDLPMVNQRVSRIHDWGGFAVAAHPNARTKLGPFDWDNRISDTEIRYAKPDAVAVYTAGPLSGREAVDKWDAVLARGLTAPTSGYRMPVYCTTEDDFTPGVTPWAFGRTWVLAELDTGGINKDSIMRALKLGRYWSYHSPISQVGTGPILTLTTHPGTDGKPVIRVTSDTTLDKITFMRNKPHVCLSPLVFCNVTQADCPVQGDELYIRVEATKGWVQAYSQAIGVKWGSGSTVSASRAEVGSPEDVTYNPAQPEELPEKMPPLGYIGRAYFASTASGVYAPDATLTLSYEGQDVVPYGMSNVAMYSWNEAAADWVKLASTVDIGNALVTAPLAQAGLYAISAEIVGDATSPTVTIHTPSDGAVIDGQEVIGVQAYDNVGVQTVSFYLGDQCVGTDSTGWDGYVCDYDFSRRAAREYVLKVVAEDVSGNSSEAQVNVIVASSGAAPTLTLDSPANGATLEDMASVTGTCGDNSLVAGVFVKVDEMTVGEADVSGGTWSYSLNTSEIANGPHTVSAMAMDDDLNTIEQGISVSVGGPTLGSLAEARSLPDGERARLAGRVVTLGNPGDDGAFYVEELSRVAGVRVLGDQVPALGDMVSISGLMSTIEGERAIVGADIASISSSNPLPRPLGLANILLGATGGFGLQSTGLLVRIWGRVTQIGDGYLYIDDGSVLKDGTTTGSQENVGVRVVCDPADYSSGQFLSVTGVSSCFETPEGRIARRVITRGAPDIGRVGP